ncbi:TPA: ead/Ea22-like family protein [Klebsiella pneumoniae]|nr:hypothetical protein [Klebsiella pneumoniae]HBZ2277515.1 hypothetical protein [Klebsiella pneumoniae]HBZ2435118.1 hypothetical protein [Klebsiella pneumoniae]HCB3379923.1 ead/Ea22-like family protein [Klebsiella pneumoniae]HCC5855576.1 ead/Ea22-like family protein [Klebsiella pneumoniae]
MTDITELAQSEINNALAQLKQISEYPTPSTQYARVLRKYILALVEALEKAQTINAAAEKLVRCKGRYHSEQNYRSLAALFGVTTPDLPPLEHENVHYADAAEMEIAALRQRIAELESRTVKLPDLRQIVSGDRYVWSDGVYNYSQDVKVALAAAGIKVEAE